MKEAFSEQLYGLFTGKIWILYEKIEAASV